MSGLDKLQKWLGTEIYECKFRPVPLSEYIVSSHKLMGAHTQEKILDLQENRLPCDRDYVGLLTAVYARKKKAVLIFCPSKNQCEEVAKRLCNWIPKQFP